VIDTRGQNVPPGLTLTPVHFDRFADPPTRAAFLCGERTVDLDGCIEIEAAHHGAPPGWIDRGAQAQWDANHMRLLDSRRASCCGNPCGPGPDASHRLLRLTLTSGLSRGTSSTTVTE
jgi:hypothetical protein